MGVVQHGYKIPLKYPLHQRCPPHDVLINEAVSVVNHTPGEYISSYFAVTKPVLRLSIVLY